MRLREPVFCLLEHCGVMPHETDQTDQRLMLSPRQWNPDHFPAIFAVHVH